MNTDDEPVGGAPRTPPGRPRSMSVDDWRRRPGRARITAAEEDGDDGGDDDWCEHGSDRHVMVHEAGHAVAALDNGIVFECIEVFGEGRAPESGPARVRFADPDPVFWAAPRPTVGLQFALA